MWVLSSYLYSALGKLAERIGVRNVAFEVIQDCNQDCVFCYNVWKSGITRAAASIPGAARTCSTASSRAIARRSSASPAGSRCCARTSFHWSDTSVGAQAAT